MTFLWLMLLLAWVTPASSGSSQDKKIFILAGQSNMSGRGGVTNVTIIPNISPYGVVKSGTWDGFVPLQCQPNSAILRLNAELTWVDSSEPLHEDIDVNKTCGVGPGMPFANAMSAKESSLGVVGLVPCAVGGTAMSEWVRGSFLYNQMIRRAVAALQGGGTIEAVLWYQGESDTMNSQDADMYQVRLENFFNDLRADLQSPVLPIIQVALASGQGPYLEQVREAQLGVSMPNVKCVDARELQLEWDHLHLSTPAQVQLGEMMANAFLQTLPSPVPNGYPKRFHIFSHDLLLYRIILIVPFFL